MFDHDYRISLLDKLLKHIHQNLYVFETLRKEQNLTQEQFAEKLGVSNRSVSRWENGNTLPDLSLMLSICEITGITLPELINGIRQDKPIQPKKTAELILTLVEHEKEDKSKRLNVWFSLGLVALLGALLIKSWPCPFYSGVLALLGLGFHAVGFIHNNRKQTLNSREKAVLTAERNIRMRFADEMVQYAKKLQKVPFPQHEKAFQKIADTLKPDEYAIFTMVAAEYAISGHPGIWHAGIAVTQERIFLCGETVAGQIMTRTVMDIYDKADILSIQHTNHSILLKTAQTTLTIKGENISKLAEAFKNAVRAEE